MSVQIPQWRRKRIRDEHRLAPEQDTRYEPQFADYACRRCHENWPCTVIVLLDALEEYERKEAQT